MHIWLKHVTLNSLDQHQHGSCGSQLEGTQRPKDSCVSGFWKRCGGRTQKMFPIDASFISNFQPTTRTSQMVGRVYSCMDIVLPDAAEIALETCCTGKVSKRKVGCKHCLVSRTSTAIYKLQRDVKSCSVRPDRAYHAMPCRPCCRYTARYTAISQYCNQSYM